MEPKKLFYIFSAAGIIFAVLFFVLFFSIALSIPLSCLGLSLPFVFIGPLFAFLFVFAIINFIAFMLLGKKDKAGLTLYGWDWMKRNLRMRIDKSFKLLPGEKEMSPMTPCYIEQGAMLGLKIFPRDIIVTNFRIIVGFQTNIFIYQAETFGEFNLWSPSIGELPDAEGMLGPLSNLLGGNTKIKKITLETDKDLGQYLRIEPSYALPTVLSIYHPESAKIFSIFSSPPKKA